MKTNTLLQRFALLAAASAMVFSFGAATLAGTRTDPCMVVHTGTGLRPTAAPSDAVITQDQLVYDLCRASDVISTQGLAADPKSDVAEIELRLRTIAAEGRLITACIRPRPSPGDEVTSYNYLAHHEFGCGPYSTAPPTTEASQSPTWGDTVCKSYITGGPRPPSPSPPPTSNPLPTRGSKSVVDPRTAHGPITSAQVAFDACYAAHVVSTSDAIDPEGRLNEDVIRLLDKLEYEGYELDHCDNSKVPVQTDPDFAKERNFGCGSYK